MTGEHLPSPGGRSLARGRITPVCTGTTEVLAEVVELVSDHPRAYGEHLNLQYKRRHQIGSPPRVRGALTAVAPCLVG